MEGPTAADTTRQTVIAEGIGRSYGARVALRDVSFAAGPGERVAVIGPNGAGKTTMLGLLAGLAPSERGRIEIAGGRAGWVPQGTALYRRLTVVENLRLFARLEGVAEVEVAVEGMLERTGLGERRDDQVASLSGGNQQRVNIALGLLREPQVLLLDEPTTALDPRQRERLWGFIDELASAGTTVVFTTHNVAEAERFGDRLLVLADGELLFDGTASELHESLPGENRVGFEAAFVAFLASKGH